MVVVEWMQIARAHCSLSEVLFNKTREGWNLEGKVSAELHSLGSENFPPLLFVWALVVSVSRNGL